MSSIGNINSGVDVNAMVDAMMSVEKLRLTRLDKTRSEYEFQLSNYNQLNNLITNFSKSLNSLDTAFTNNCFQVSSSNDSALTATLTGNNIAPGSYTVAITQLATGSQIASSAFNSTTQALNLSAPLQLQVGTAGEYLSLSPTDTLESIKDGINKLSLNESLKASILATTSANGSAEYRLLLTSTGIGEANTILIAEDAGLGLNQVLSVAQDALFTFDGFNVQRPTNTITDIIEGLSFTLNAGNNQATIQVGADTPQQNTNISTALQSCIDNYNSIIAFIDKSQSKSLLRDGSYPLIKLALQKTMKAEIENSSISGLFNLGLETAPALKKVNDEGVTYVTSGELNLDTSLFTQALVNNFSTVNSFFTQPDTGFIASLQNTLNDLTASDGGIMNRETMIQQQEKIVDQKIMHEEARLDSVRHSLIEKWSSVNLFVIRYQQLSSYLEQQLTILNNNYNHKN